MDGKQKYAEIVKRRVIVDVWYRESPLGPMFTVRRWFRVLPLAVYDDLMKKLDGPLDSADAMCGNDWHRVFNPAAVSDIPEGTK